MKTLLIVLFCLLLETETETDKPFTTDDGYLDETSTNARAITMTVQDAGANKQDIAGVCKKDRHPFLKPSVPI